MRKMNLFIGCLFSVMLGLYSCVGSKLERQAEEVNAECPKNVGDLGVMSGVRYEEGKMIFDYLVNEDKNDMDVLKGSSDMIKIVTIQSLPQSVKDVVVDEKADLVFNFKGKKTGKTFSFSVSSKELALGGKASDSHSKALLALQALVNANRGQFPAQVSKGLTIVNLSIEGDGLVYDVATDESIYPIDELTRGKAQMKNDIKGSLTADGSMKEFFKACINADKRVIRYRYKGTRSGKTCVIEIPLSELKVEK